MKRAERKLRQRYKKHCAEWPSYPDGDIRTYEPGSCIRMVADNRTTDK